MSSDDPATNLDTLRIITPCPNNLPPLNPSTDVVFVRSMFICGC